MKTLLYMATTVNGFVATEHDETPWSDAVWELFGDFVRQRKNLIVGRRTYELMRETEGEFEKIGYPLTVVLTREGNVSLGTNAIKAASPAEALEIVKKAGFTEAIVGGGADANGAFVAANLVDEILLDVEPMIFGTGIPLLKGFVGMANLKLIEAKHENGLLRLHYEVMK